MTKNKRSKSSTKAGILYVLLSASVLLLVALLCFYCSSFCWPESLLNAIVEFFFSRQFLNRVSVYLNDRKFMLFFCNVLLVVVAMDFGFMGTGGSSSSSAAAGKNRGVYEGFYSVRKEDHSWGVARYLDIGEINAGGHSVVGGGGGVGEEEDEEVEGEEVEVEVEEVEEVEDEEVLLDAEEAVIEEEEQGEEEVEETEDEVTKELDAEELKRKFDRFIENFKRERRMEARRLVLV